MESLKKYPYEVLERFQKELAGLIDEQSKLHQADRNLVTGHLEIIEEINDLLVELTDL